MWYELLRGAFGFDFLWRLANHQGFGLGEEVGGKHSVFLSAVSLVWKEAPEGPTFGACCSGLDCGSRQQDSKLLYPSLLRQLDKQLQCLLGHKVLREAKEDLGLVGSIMKGTGELFEAQKIFLKEFLEYNVAALGGVVSLELSPCFKVAGLGE